MKSPSATRCAEHGAFVPWTVSPNRVHLHAIVTSSRESFAHRRDSALALTLAYPFQEAFADKAHFFKVREVDREQGICQIKPQYQIVEVFNLPILFFFGLMARLLALALLRFTALHKRGEVPLRSRIIGLCCCRGRNRDTPLARWASTPSFLTGSLSTNATPSMENEREPDSPTTTEQPRATNFDSVPSIPSDLF